MRGMQQRGRAAVDSRWWLLSVRGACLRDASGDEGRRGKETGATGPSRTAHLSVLGCVVVSRRGRRRDWPSMRWRASESETAAHGAMMMASADKDSTEGTEGTEGACTQQPLITQMTAAACGDPTAYM